MVDDTTAPQFRVESRFSLAAAPMPMPTPSNETGGTRVTWPDVRIASWAELQEIIDPLAGGCVFRGQGSMDWPLLPSFNRAVTASDEVFALRLEMATVLRHFDAAPIRVAPCAHDGNNPDDFPVDAEFSADEIRDWSRLAAASGANPPEPSPLPPMAVPA